MWHLHWCEVSACEKPEAKEVIRTEIRVRTVLRNICLLPRYPRSCSLLTYFSLASRASVLLLTYTTIIQNISKHEHENGSNIHRNVTSLTAIALSQQYYTCQHRPSHRAPSIHPVLTIIYRKKKQRKQQQRSCALVPDMQMQPPVLSPSSLSHKERNLTSPKRRHTHHLHAQTLPHAHISAHSQSIQKTKKKPASMYGRRTYTPYDLNIAAH